MKLNIRKGGWIGRRKIPFVRYALTGFIMVPAAFVHWNSSIAEPAKLTPRSECAAERAVRVTDVTISYASGAVTIDGSLVNELAIPISVVLMQALCKVDGVDREVPFSVGMTTVRKEVWNHQIGRAETREFFETHRTPPGGRRSFRAQVAVDGAVTCRGVTVTGWVDADRESQ